MNYFLVVPDMEISSSNSSSKSSSKVGTRLWFLMYISFGGVKKSSVMNLGLVSAQNGKS